MLSAALVDGRAGAVEPLPWDDEPEPCEDDAPWDAAEPWDDPEPCDDAWPWDDAEPCEAAALCDAPDDDEPAEGSADAGVPETVDASLTPLPDALLLAL